MIFMNGRSKVVKKNFLRGYIAQLLIMSIVFTGFSPAGIRSVAESNTETNNWKTDYYLEVNGAIPLSTDDDAIVVDVKGGDLVGLGMELVSKTIASRRFDETFRIDMPEILYGAFVDYNQQHTVHFMPGEVTGSGYLLDILVNDHSSLASPGNASPGNASWHNATYKKGQLTLSFVEELRKAADPKRIIIEPTEDILYFEAPEDMQLVLSQKDNNCRIEIAGSKVNTLMIRPHSSDYAEASIDAKVYAAGNIEGSQSDDKWWQPCEFKFAVYLMNGVDPDTVFYNGDSISREQLIEKSVSIPDGSPADISVGGFEFAEDGEYIFRIYQNAIIGGTSDIRRDYTNYYVKITISDSLSHIDVNYYTDSDLVNAIEEISFINSKSIIEIKAKNYIENSYGGRDLAKGFELIAVAEQSYEGMPEQLLKESLSTDYYGTGNVTFDKIPVKNITNTNETIKYVYRVSVVNKNEPGIEYSDEEYKYTVTYNWNEGVTGKVSIEDKAGNAVDEMVFVNRLNRASAVLSFTKQLYDKEGNLYSRDIPRYYFEISLAGNPSTHKNVVMPDETVVFNGSYDGRIRFNEIYFLKSGTYQFVVREKERQYGGIITDKGEILVTVEVSPDDLYGKNISTYKIAYEKHVDGEIVATEKYVNSIKEVTGNGEAKIFVNRATRTAPAYVQFEMQKHMVGTAAPRLFPGVGITDPLWNEEEIFSFEVKLLSQVSSGDVICDDRVFMKDDSFKVTQVFKWGGVLIEFEPFEIFADGTYMFSLREIPGDDDTIHYDSNVYYAKVEISDNQTKQKITYYGDEEATTEVDNVGFINSKTAFQFQVKKILLDMNGNEIEMKGGEFEFVAKLQTDSQGFADELRATNDENGVVLFPAQPWSDIKGDVRGGHVYKITEVRGNEPGMHYSDEEYTVTLSYDWLVGSGVVYEIKNKDGKVITQYDKVTFTNYLNRTEEQFVLQKQLLDPEGKAEDTVPEFKFQLSIAGDGSSHDSVTMPEVTEVMNNTNGEIRFDKVYFKAEGVYQFVVQEIAGTDSEITYDGGKVCITVKVEADINDALYVSEVSYDKYVDDVKVSDDNTDGKLFINIM